MGDVTQITSQVTFDPENHDDWVDGDLNEGMLPSTPNAVGKGKWGLVVEWNDDFKWAHVWPHNDKQLHSSLVSEEDGCVRSECDCPLEYGLSDCGQHVVITHNYRRPKLISIK